MGLKILNRLRLWWCQTFHHRDTGWTWDSSTRTTKYRCRCCGCEWAWEEGLPW